jgi:hypothetical protein
VSSLFRPFSVPAFPTEAGRTSLPIAFPRHTSALLGQLIGRCGEVVPHFMLFRQTSPRPRKRRRAGLVATQQAIAEEQGSFSDGKTSKKRAIYTRLSPKHWHGLVLDVLINAGRKNPR